MALLDLQLLLPGDDLETWTDAFLAAGALSASVEDEDGDTPDEEAVYGEPGLAPARPAWRNNRVSVLLEERADPAAWLAAVAAALGREVPPLRACVRLDDRDWVRQTQSQFAPVTVGRFAIVPSWHEPPADAATCVVRIDPGIAFGTGTHPTTRLCLAWISAHLRAGASVLDYGCGSGILSIGAALLGAGAVLGVDIDAQAVATAQDNAQRNGADAQYTSPENLALDRTRTFDLVVANILANPIALLAPTLARRVRAGGTLLLSGILERQAGTVIEAYRQAEPRLAWQVCGEDEGWVALAGTMGA
jgi:ribosomal protein L11 methyltransferase